MMMMTNRTVSYLVEALAVELTPLRAAAVLSGLNGSGAWNGMGEEVTRGMIAETAASSAVGRDVVSALLAVDNRSV